MNKWLKIIGTFGIVALVSAALAGAVALAQSDGGAFGPRRGFAERGVERASFEGRSFFDEAGTGPRRGGPRGRAGLGGQVTALGDDSLTIENKEGASVTVTVTEDTRVMVAETQSEGSLGDITVGANVRVMGHPAEGDDSVEARGILLLPTGDMARGRVTAVDNNVITVENRREESSAIIVTDGDTRFMLGRDGDEGSLADVTEDKGVMAFGDTQDDGSLAANVVFVHEGRGPGGPGHHGPGEGHAGGEVTAIDGSSFTIDPFRGEADSLTILTDDDTEYRTRSETEVSFEDIEVGGHVMVKGQPVDGQEDTIRAEVVGIKIDK